MKKIYISGCLLLLLFQLISASLRPVSLAWAQTIASPTPVDYQLPYPGLLPDHPLYPLKKIRDTILILLTISPEKKIELNMLFADKKIGMADGLIAKRENKLAVEIIRESQLDMLKAASLLPELEKKNLLPVNLPDKIALAAKKHREIISEIALRIKEPNGQTEIKKALDLNNQAKLLIESVKRENTKV